jgi:hypothetical protein
MGKWHLQDEVVGGIICPYAPCMYTIFASFKSIIFVLYNNAGCVDKAAESGVVGVL